MTKAKANYLTFALVGNASSISHYAGTMIK